jgi:tetratricopeptide (TPR) repeat protein
LAASPRSPLAHHTKGGVLRAQERWDEAVSEYEAAFQLDRNKASALWCLSFCKLHAGPIEEVIPLAEQAIRLSPRDPYIGYPYFLIGAAHLLQSRTDEAIVWLEKARSAMPAHPNSHAYLASGYALRGETERAAAELAEARKLVHDGRYSSVAHVKLYRAPGIPKYGARYEATYFAGLRKAGMPEE